MALLRSFGRLFFFLIATLYDFIRFVRYGGWRLNMKDKRERNYSSVRVYLLFSELHS